jgi:hypothetical protein
MRIRTLGKGLCLSLIVWGNLAAKAEEPLVFKFDDVVSRSFPPNLNWLDFGQPGFDAHRFATFGPGQWIEFVLQVPRPGTYQIQAQMVQDGSSGIVQPSIDGDIQGEPLDLFAASRSTQLVDFGKHTFAKAGKALLRLSIAGKNPKSNGYLVDLDSISLTPAQGFLLLAPEGARFDQTNPILNWAGLGHDYRYTVYLDNTPLPEVKNTSLETKNLSAGDHQWYVIAENSERDKQRSNTFHFRIGSAAPYPDRDFTDDFASGDSANYVNQGMGVVDDSDKNRKSLTGTVPSRAYLKDVQLGLREGEVSALVTLDDPKSSASVGFTDPDGTRICAVINGDASTISLERTVRGYSIFTITPPAYRLKQWKESQTSKGEYVWQLSSAPVTVKPGTTYRLKLAYSRRSCAVMATWAESDGSNAVTLRDLVDINLPDRPMLAIGQGKVRFDQFAYRRLNRHVYPWDIDTNQVVIRPGPAGSWDSRGVFNSAVIVRGNSWYMVYRGNAKPAPPNGPAASDLGVATSSDGVHWLKDSHNPILARSPSQGTVEDPDLLLPDGTDTYHMEYVILRPRGYQPSEPGVHEMMATSTDGVHYSEPWRLPVKGKIGGMIDTHNNPKIPEFDFGGQKYRYLAAIEEGGIYLSNDLHAWVKMGDADTKGRPDIWCNFHECAGDIFVDFDHNLRIETQAGTDKRISGNRLCTNVEDILSGSNPTQLIARGDLPWLPDFYGDAPTGDLNEMTFTNGSVFPGQTVVKDGYLWHYYGGNNTFVGLIKCAYRPVFNYRDLHVTRSPAKGAAFRLEVTIRNDGSFAGETNASVLLDGNPAAVKPVTLARDEEKKIDFDLVVPAGLHVVAIDTLRASVQGDAP